MDLIKVNLAPLDEIESPYWYVPDLLVVVIVLFVGVYAVDLHLTETQEEILALQAKKEELRSETQKLERNLTRYKDLDKSIATLNDKISSLKDITKSKVKRYRPIILMEHIQNLRPDGLWFTSVEENSGENTIVVKGFAFDSILVAEFLASIDATQYQEEDASDLRSQVYFSDYQLSNLTKKDKASGLGGDITEPVEFRLNLFYQEREIFEDEEEDTLALK